MLLCAGGMRVVTGRLLARSKTCSNTVAGRGDGRGVNDEKRPRAIR